MSKKDGIFHLLVGVGFMIVLGFITSCEKYEEVEVVHQIDTVYVFEEPEQSDMVLDTLDSLSVNLMYAWEGYLKEGNFKHAWELVTPGYGIQRSMKDMEDKYGTEDQYYYNLVDVWMESVNEDTNLISLEATVEVVGGSDFDLMLAYGQLTFLIKYSGSFKEGFELKLLR